ncbi:MAG: alpha/beta hydrolase [Gammaproteobacteria bacterium]|jgi:pimeloyl-ACP methyl ester carboxylesterase|nr:alpha/beta hydrolase [Gammaproteobacteria bacterium]
MNHRLSSACLILCLYCSTAAGEQIVVNCQGTGQPVYLIGGGPAFTSWNLEPIQQRLRDRFKVCRYDMRGVGENATLSIKHDSPVLSQWLQDMAQILPEQPVLIWGHSWGALQSLLFSRLYPERVKALVLSNPVDPELASLEHIESKRFMHPNVQSQLRLDDIDTAAEQRHSFRSKIASYFVDAEKGWQYSAQFDHNDTNNRLNIQIWQEYRQMPLLQHELKQLSAKISALIYCRQDVLMPENYDNYSSALPTVKHYMINDCAHFPWVETPAEYFEILQQTIVD